MTYRVISKQKWDGKQNVKFYDSYEDARKEAERRVMCGLHENVTIRDEHDIKCSFKACGIVY